MLQTYGSLPHAESWPLNKQPEGRRLWDPIIVPKMNLVEVRHSTGCHFPSPCIEGIKENKFATFPCFLNLQDVYKRQASVVRHGFHHHPLFFVCPGGRIVEKATRRSAEVQCSSHAGGMEKIWWQVVMDVTMVWCPTLEQKLEHGNMVQIVDLTITWGLGLGSRFRGATFPDHSHMSPIRSASWGKKHGED